MEPNKIHERVLEIQKNISNLSPEQQTEMLGELLDLASKLEQSLSEIKIEDNEEQYRTYLNDCRYINTNCNVIWLSNNVIMELVNANYI